MRLFPLKFSQLTSLLCKIIPGDFSSESRPKIIAILENNKMYFSMFGKIQFNEQFQRDVLKINIHRNTVFDSFHDERSWVRRLNTTQNLNTWASKKNTCTQNLNRCGIHALEDKPVGAGFQRRKTNSPLFSFPCPFALFHYLFQLTTLLLLRLRELLSN